MKLRAPAVPQWGLWTQHNICFSMLAKRNILKPSPMYWTCLIAAIGSHLQLTGFGVKKKKKKQHYLAFLSVSLFSMQPSCWIRTSVSRLWHHAVRHVGAPLHFKMAAKNGAVVSFVYSWDALLCSSLIDWTQPPHGSAPAFSAIMTEQIHCTFRCQRVVMEKRYLYTVSE